jgi:hydrogenase maturation protein HypF
MEVVARPRVEGEDRETSGGASAGPHGGRLNWAPLVRAALDDLERGIGVDRIARRIHNGLAQGISEVAGAVGLVRVVLSGGCFHNVLLTREARARLRARGHDVLLHRQVPPGDGGLSLGQVAVVAALLDE